MIKRKLRFFCDYMADSPLWEDYSLDTFPEDEYNKSKKSLKQFGVSDLTIKLMGKLQLNFEKQDTFEEKLTTAEICNSLWLTELIIKRLQEEIGDKFEIEVL